ncbi:hypothetical protein [Embleya sp. AB8]|uniref:hypothetical protein n=1 Tax=Embleya sp. AB8 TaxID=3156304 RepID=UPI003C7343B7
MALLEDPLLGPLITPERGLELLATPRGGGTGDTPPAAPDLDPEDLAWLAEPDHNGRARGYRFVLVEGATPAELPAYLGADENAAPHVPMTRWEAENATRTRENSSYRDLALVAIGRAAPGWSFAFDADPSPFHAARFVSPAGAASRAGRAVVVWCAPAQPAWSPEVFHLSVAEGGGERYACTVHGTEITRSGEIPATLDPERLFTRGPSGGSGEEAEELVGPSGRLRALEAITAEFGVTLPRFALTQGRLHTLHTRSWTRPPGPGESYMVISLG